MLLDPSQPRSVAEVSAAVGLTNAAHFSRIFRARYGLSPREAPRPTSRHETSWLALLTVRRSSRGIGRTAPAVEQQHATNRPPRQPRTPDTTGVLKPPTTRSECADGGGGACFPSASASQRRRGSRCRKGRPMKAKAGGSVFLAMDRVLSGYARSQIAQAPALNGPAPRRSVCLWRYLRNPERSPVLPSLMSGVRLWVGAGD